MRQLATVRKIDDLTPIPDADKIECATIGGWKVVVQKGLYKVGDLAVYCEIDSWIPSTIAPFLTKAGHPPKEFEGVVGERLKTVKLRGQVSQGLLLPGKQGVVEGKPTFYFTMDAGSEGAFVVLRYDEGADVTEDLGILKWEKPLPAQLQGKVRGNFPHFIPKTDQERIQNLSRAFEEWRHYQDAFEVTEKLDGSSMTVYVHEDRFGVCSRNLDLIETPENAMWALARRWELEEKLRAACGGNLRLALQGELIGQGIQGNPYKLSDVQYRVFDIWDIGEQRYFTAAERWDLCSQYNIPHVPLVLDHFTIPESYSIADLINMADDQSLLEAKAIREGLVFKHKNDARISFKAISNRYLLKHGD